MSRPAKSPSKSDETVSFFSLATAAAVFAILIWGSSALVTKLGIRSIDSFTLSLLRTVASIPFALLIIWYVRGKLPWHGADKFHLLGMAITGLIGFPVLFTLGVGLTTAGHAAVANTSMPLFAGLLEALYNRRWPAVRWWVGISIAFAGAVVLIAEAIGVETSGATWQGDLLVIAGSFSAALSFIFGARLVPRYGSASVTMWSVVLAGLLLLPLVFLRMDMEMLRGVTVTGWLSVLYLALGSTILAYVTWIYALMHGGIGRMSTWQYASPVVGVAAAAIFLAEPLTPMLMAATVVILLGVALVQRR